MKRNSSNSSNAFALDAPVELGRSTRLGIFYLVLHLGALVSVVAVPLPVLARIGLVAGIFVSLVSIWRRHVSRQHRCAVRALRPSGTDSLALVLADREQEAVYRIGPAFVHPWIVLAAVRTDRGRHAMVVPRDATSADAFHRLRVFLHTRRAA
jgi:hypothetical protein